MTAQIQVAEIMTQQPDRNVAFAEPIHDASDVHGKAAPREDGILM